MDTHTEPDEVPVDTDNNPGPWDGLQNLPQEAGSRLPGDDDEQED
ncbi:hypothetical protein [Jiangella muralis]|nr:hypothetical protein [Jiangella muralis]